MYSCHDIFTSYNEDFVTIVSYAIINDCIIALINKLLHKRIYFQTDSQSSTKDIDGLVTTKYTPDDIFLLIFRLEKNSHTSYHHISTQNAVIIVYD